MDYEGRVFATTTLSVKDWQEYLGNRDYLAPKAKFLCTYVKDFNAGDRLSDFAKNLQDWNFMSITELGKRSRKYYENQESEHNVLTAKELRESFLEYDEDAAEIYENIYPNYISAFCFDSIRLFAKMHHLNAKSLYDKKMKEKKNGHVDSSSPFKETELFKYNGKPEVALAIEDILT